MTTAFLMELLDKTTADYRDMKFDMLTPDWRAPASDLPIRVEAYVGERPLGLLLIANRDEALRAASILRRGLSADAIVFGFDAHMKKYTPEQFEREGPPAPGSLQAACHADGACERGEISDVLVIHAVNAATHVTRMMPYGLHEAEPHIEWADETNDEGTIGGLIIETLSAAMKMPDLPSAVIERKLGMGGMTPEALANVARAMAIRALQSLSLSVALLLTPEEIAELDAVDEHLVAAMEDVT